jgi:hypothetical protein
MTFVLLTAFEISLALALGFVAPAAWRYSAAIRRELTMRYGPHIKLSILRLCFDASH